VLEFDASTLTTATTRLLSAPPADGVIATQAYVTARLPTGTALSGYYGTAAPPGFVRAGGLTIGSATSSATERANADTQNLFLQLWTRFNGSNVVGGAGASAAADWAANKQLTLPDHSGRLMAGRDDLSGTNRGILSPSGIASTTIGAVGGAATESAGVSVSGSLGVSTSVSVSGAVNLYANPSGAEVAAAASGNGASARPHDHSVTGNVSLGGSGSGSASGSMSGATNAVTNAQPTIMVDVIIAL
jgi:hypothetical protein